MPLYLIKPALVQAPVILAVLYVEEVSDAAGAAADKEAARPGKEKENGNASTAAAGHELIKPVPGRSRFGSQSEANPLAALNPGCAPLFTHIISLSLSHRQGTVKLLDLAQFPLTSVSCTVMQQQCGANSWQIRYIIG